MYCIKLCLTALHLSGFAISGRKCEQNSGFPQTENYLKRKSWQNPLDTKYREAQCLLAGKPYFRINAPCF
jgi:hypothetical protein